MHGHMRHVLFQVQDPSAPEPKQAPQSITLHTVPFCMSTLPRHLTPNEAQKKGYTAEDHRLAVSVVPLTVLFCLLCFYQPVLMAQASPVLQQSEAQLRRCVQNVGSF